MTGQPFALGLMSGTSADGVSLALVDARPRVLEHATYAYSPALRRRVLGAAALAAAELSALDFDLGRLFARAAVRFLRRRRVSPRRLAAVGSHGQTVVHRPARPRPSTLQIGEPSFLAEALGAPVVADFRPRDIAAGGEGAPLVAFFDEVLFGGGPPVILQNIGGIGNASFVGRGVRTIAFDTGPGNVLMDLAVRRLTKGALPYDRGGRIAAGGRADEARAARLLRAPFFRRRPPKSLDRSAFAEDYLRRHFPPGWGRGADTVATLTYFTALSIADACRRHLPFRRARRLVLSGGGALNAALVGQLRRLLAPLPVQTSADFGVPVLAKEPAAIALMALYAVRGKTNHCPEATGAARPRILGKITF
ncbi:MAG: anhydro-N-acetylmuramic acid kinase [Elusimicrobiota bacterium]